MPSLLKRVIPSTLVAVLIVGATVSCAQNGAEETDLNAPNPSLTAPVPTVNGAGKGATPEPTLDGDTPVANGGYVKPTAAPAPTATQIEPNQGSGGGSGAGASGSTGSGSSAGNTGAGTKPANGWQQATAGDWLTLTIPANWKIIAEGQDTHYLVDNKGNKHLYLLQGTEGQYAPDGCSAEPATFTVLDSQKSNAMSGRNLVLASLIQPITYGSDTQPAREAWEFDAGITQPELIKQGVCEPFFGFYSGDTYMAVKIVADPWDGLYFNSEIAAKAYAGSKEFALLKQVMESAQVKG